MKDTSNATPTWAVLGLALATLVKAVLWALDGRAGEVLSSRLDTTATVLVVLCLAVIGVRLVSRLRRRLLWRVRRKLVLSYVFIGLIPVVLIGVFFVLVGALAMLTAGSHFVSRSLDALVVQAGLVADAIADDVELDSESSPARLEHRRTAFRARYPGLSIVLIQGDADASLPTAGNWSHAPPPRRVPAWMSEAGFDGLVVVEDGGSTRLVARSLRELGARSEAVVVDIPLGPDSWARLFDDTGVLVGSPLRSGDAPEALEGAADTMPWFSFIAYTNWETGQRELINVETTVSARRFYARVFGAQTRLGDVSLGYAFLVALAAVGVLFLIIEGTALVMGFVLARSITGSVHELFIGTEHVRRGDLGHRIRVETHDQLGELAESFNAMTGSVKDLLQEAAEKRRLEEELRIARRIQMSLLPRDEVTIPGISVSAACVPAREVGGDYYDLVRLDAHRLGVLVADVSGKGTSAAFYMAELKGLMLSLSRIHHSPRQLLVEVNRTIAPHIDSRSFITMIYAVVDLTTRTLTYARAGHTPLLYVRNDTDSPRAEWFMPNGLVVGLDGFEAKFEELIVEQTIDIRPGDLAVLFTDGISEAMNQEADLFGEDRLGRLVEANAGRGAAEIREEVFAGVTAFVGDADQHDDMTLVLVKIEEGVASIPSESSV